MKKKNLFPVLLLIVALIMWSFVACGPAEKKGETPEVKEEKKVEAEPAVAEAAKVVNTEDCECTLTVYLLAAASFKNNPVITEVDFNGSVPGNPPLTVGENVAIANEGVAATYGIFVCIKEGKPVTIKLKTDDGAIATFTIPCNTAYYQVSYPSNEYSVIAHPKPDYNAIEFDFQPKVGALAAVESLADNGEPTNLKINISLKAEGDQEYLKDVSGLIIGNMVDPVTGNYWYGPISQGSWTWNYSSPDNYHAFGLMSNYTYQGDPVVKTALSKVVIDPTKMTNETHEVVAYLETCEIGKGNIVLRFKNATLDGKDVPDAVYTNDWGTEKKQPDCTFCTKCDLK